MREMMAMLQERAKVVALEEHGAWVETQRKSACGGCAQGGSCGTGALAQWFKPAVTRFHIQAERPLQLGEEVWIGLDERALLRSALLVYLLPLLGLFMAALAWQALGGGETGSVLAGLAGLAVGFVAVRGFSRRFAKDARYHPVLLE
jgi:sigma-E factor negative regulatory protein RseC